MSSFIVPTSTSDARMKAQLDTMRDAEEKLISYSHRFNDDNDQNKKSIIIDIVDTKIPMSVVPLKSNGVSTCYFRSSVCRGGDDAADNNGKQGTEEEREQFVIHGIKVTSPQKKNVTEAEKKAPLVLLHGYGGASLYYYRNLVGLAKYYGTVYAIDMLGWGLSSRPAFDIVDPSVETTELFFVNSLEAWRKQNGIEKMILGGHSIGGYLSVAYCERCPECVERLILLSPAGVPHAETDVNLDRNKSKRRTLTSRLLRSVFRTLFHYGVTPNSIVRSMSEKRGRSIAQSGLPDCIVDEEEQRALVDYFYMNAILPGSGEYCLNRLLTPTTHGRKPTVDRIPNLDIPHIAFVYGEHDMMTLEAGVDVQRVCEGMRKDCLSDAPKVQIYIVRESSHFVMLSNWEESNSAVIMAGGGEHTLPQSAPRPLELTYQENDQEEEVGLETKSEMNGVLQNGRTSVQSVGVA